ncbi:hypothetical protein NQZ68_016885 [Dissostichus eleginoides]|nr:hypothetical protein NQZ68_016885 [Dissostichus eleginoides]
MNPTVQLPALIQQEVETKPLVATNISSAVTEETTWPGSVTGPQRLSQPYLGHIRMMYTCPFVTPMFIKVYCMWLMPSPHVPQGTPVRAMAAAPPFPALNVNAQRAEQTVSHPVRQATAGPEPTSKEDEDADVPDEPLPIINDEDEEERQLQQAQGSSPLLSCNSPSMSMEDEGDKSIENISESDTDEAEMSESRAAPCSETVLSWNH